MSKGELKSLNDLAMAHGGQLTINPQTGLPEAGFLSSILPVVAGAALNAFVPGLGAMGSALLTGAVSGIASGSLSKGLMAGMGAYGGAGLMGGVLGAGEGALAAQGIQAGMPQFTGDTAAYADQVNALRASEMAKVADAPFMDKAKAGFSQIGEAPGDFFKNNWKYAAAAAPSVIEAVSGSGGKAPTPASDKDMGQRYVYEPNKLQGPYTASPTGVEQQYFNPNFRKVSGTEAKSVFGYASGGAVDEPVKYDYDPLTQIFKKIESMPSDNQKVNEPSPIGGRGGANPNQARTNAYFDGMTPAQKSSHNEGLANVLNALAPGAAIRAMMNAPEGKISPLAVPSLAMSKLGDAAQTGLGVVLNKFAKPNPNPDAVQVVDMSSLSPAAEGESAQQALQAQAIATALSGLQGVGGEGGAGMGIGFGAPGATSGNAGAMGFGPSGMAAKSVGATGGGATGGGATGGGGGGGAPGAPGLGVSSGGGYGISPSMGGTAGVGGTAGAAAGAARGGLMAAYSNGDSHLGDYSDGGRLLKGPGDGVSDSIPAMIGRKQPARLADGEFVVPARIVSELGNGSTEAGARKLYAMMDRVQKARGKTVGKGKVAKNSRSERFLPA
jgi:hypothetical protein